MPRYLSSPAVASVHALQTQEVWLVLLTLVVGTTTIRVVNNNANIVSRGNTFQAFPFEIVLPGEDPDTVPKATLRIDATDKSVVAAIRSVSTPPTCTLEVIMASSPDTVEASYPNLVLRNVQYDASFVSGELYFESLYSEPITVSMTPSRFPGMF